MTIVGKINTYEFEKLERQLNDDARVMCHKERRSAAICGAALGFEIGLVAMMLLVCLEAKWIDAIPLPFICTILGSFVAHANQCAEKEECDYFTSNAAYEYYRFTNGKHVIKEDCYVYDDYARLYVTAANANGIVENCHVVDLNIAHKIGIDDITVSLTDGTAYIPYQNS